MGICVSSVATPPPEAVSLFEGPVANLFLHPRWMRAMTAAYPRFRPRCFVLEEEGEIRGLLPWIEGRRYGFREVLSMPFGTYGGPVLTDCATPEGASALVRAFVTETRGPRAARSDMVVLDPPPAVRRSCESVLGPGRPNAATLELDLSPGEDRLWSDYSQQLRRSVRRAEDAGVTTVRETGPDAEAAFYRLYRHQSHTQEITWHHTAAAVSAVVRELGDDARFWITRENGAPLCAQLALYHRDREVYLWASGAVPKSRPVYAFHHMIHTLIGDACRRGLRTCDFGTSMGNPGVLKFKRAFGAEERPILRYLGQARWVDWVQRVRW